MSRFRVETIAERVKVSFDDGAMNLLSSSALDELSSIIDSIPPATKVLAFCSGRTSIFAAGADMREMSVFGPDAASAFALQGQELFSRIRQLELISMIFIDGDCFGGALDLTLSFDLRYITARARFAHPGARIGIVTGFGGTSRWFDVMRKADAARLLLANEIFDAERAMSSGLASRLIETMSSDAIWQIMSEVRADLADVRISKALLNHASRLSSSQLVSLAQRLTLLYRGDRIGTD